MRSCCDPGASTLRSGPRVVHLTNLYQGASWGPIEFGFYELLDPTNPESGPDPSSPVDLTGSTWVMPAYPIDDPDATAFVEWDIDDSDQSNGVITVSVPDPADTAEAVIGVDCTPTYVYELWQTRDGVELPVIIGTLLVVDAHSLLAV